jgi:hypothetical protein
VYIRFVSPCPVSDISGPDGGPDCKVNFYDYSALAVEWGDTIDFIDLLELANEWLTSGPN